MGYLPGTIWLLVGVVLAGAVQDFLVLFISTRRDGKSLGEMAKLELGSFAGVVVMLGALGVMIIILAVLALVVVKALAHSPWGVFSIAATIPIALLMGVYMRYIRPGKIAEVSIIGFVLMMLVLFMVDISRLILIYIFHFNWNAIDMVFDHLWFYCFCFTCLVVTCSA